MKEKELTAKIRELLSARSAESSICPSDVARAAAPDDWRPLMEPVREAAATWWPTAKYRSPGRRSRRPGIRTRSDQDSVGSLINRVTSGGTALAA